MQLQQIPFDMIMPLLSHLLFDTLFGPVALAVRVPTEFVNAPYLTFGS